MDIISQKPIKGRLQDGLDTIFALSDDEFVKFLNNFTTDSRINFFYVTDNCERPDRPIKLGIVTDFAESRAYYVSERVKISEFFSALSSLVAQPNADNATRARAILRTRNINTFQKHYANINERSMRSVATAFNVLQNEKLLYEFLKTSDNMENLVIDDQIFNKREALEILGDIFGYPVENGEFKRARGKMNGYYIPNIDCLIESYSKLYNSGYNLDMYADGDYTFKSECTKSGQFLSKVEDGEWKLNDLLEREVYEDMPPNFLPEEKALYVYVKLCSILGYDENVAKIEGKRISKIDKSVFNKVVLEAIKPNDKILCYDFARVCANFLNEIDGVKAFVLSQGLIDGHYLTGFYTDKISAKLESVNIDDRALNDLSRARNKMELSGIEIVADKFNIIPKTLERVYSSVYGQEKMTFNCYCEKIKEQKNNEIKLDKLIDSFIATLKQNHISGNEATITYNMFKRCGFFGENLESVYIGEKHIVGNEIYYQRKILLRKNGEDNPYLIDVVNLTARQLPICEVAKNFKSKDFVYESAEYRLKGLEKVN